MGSSRGSMTGGWPSATAHGSCGSDCRRRGRACEALPDVAGTRPPWGIIGGAIPAVLVAGLTLRPGDAGPLRELGVSLAVGARDGPMIPPGPTTPGAVFDANGMEVVNGD